MESDVKGTFNIGYGKRVSINELANKIMEIVGVKLNPVYSKPRSRDVIYSLADISKAELIGYESIYRLEDRLKKAIRWFKMN